MSQPFVLAHISDVHLGPLPRLGMRHWNVKRTLGWLNWTRTRRVAHRPEVLAQLLADMAEQAPDHIAVTGDLINIGLPDEYAAAARWLEELGSPTRVSLVPGNHDIYTRLRGDSGVARWADYMTSGVDGAEERGKVWSLARFPWVRRIGTLALVGVNSAVPTRPLRAIGHVGEEQLARLASVLQALASEPVTRVVLIHHPALPGQASPAKALTDAPALTAVLERHGVELVLHGHNHRSMLAFRQGPAGEIAFVGVPSASLAIARHREDLARYHLYRLLPGDRWAPIEMIGRGLASPDGPVVEIERRWLVPDRARPVSLPGTVGST